MNGNIRPFFVQKCKKMANLSVITNFHKTLEIVIFLWYNEKKVEKWRW